MGPTETSISVAKNAVLNTLNHRRGLGPIETGNFGTKDVVLFAKIHR